MHVIVTALVQAPSLTVWSSAIVLSYCGWVPSFLQSLVSSEQILPTTPANVRYFSQEWLSINHWLDTTHHCFTQHKNNARPQKMHVFPFSRIFFWLRKIVHCSKYNTSTSQQEYVKCNLLVKFFRLRHAHREKIPGSLHFSILQVMKGAWKQAYQMSSHCQHSS